MCLSYFDSFLENMGESHKQKGSSFVSEMGLWTDSFGLCDSFLENMGESHTQKGSSFVSEMGPQD